MNIIEYTTKGGKNLIKEYLDNISAKELTIMKTLQGTKIQLEDLEIERQELINSDTELKKSDEEWEQEYQVRKKLREARETAGINQKLLGILSGLDHRAISRVETNTNVSPNLKTVIKYLNAIGYKLDVVKVE